jgi:2-oxoacid:acceptor oxidoreductase delta subunit (pyruvate/2-ketoisovalerate family)
MLTIERMELDENGFPRPTGHLEQLPADSLVLALGQESDLALLAGVPGLELANGNLVVDDNLMTGRPGLFAGGDVVPDVRSATVAIGHGRRAAASIDRWLRGTAVADEEWPGPATYDRLNTWYYTDAPRAHRPLLEAARRASTFDEVVQGLDEETALYEARRCLSCGTCFSCDNCFGMCPDNAIVPTGDPRAPYAVDLEYCKGCGICAAECPSGAISMVPEDI